MNAACFFAINKFNKIKGLYSSKFHLIHELFSFKHSYLFTNTLIFPAFYPKVFISRKNAFDVRMMFDRIVFIAIKNCQCQLFRIASLYW